MVIGQPSIDWQTSNIIEGFVICNNMSSVLCPLSLRKLVVIPIMMSFRELTRGLAGVEWMALC